MNWVRLLGPVLGPFTGTVERRVAIRKAKWSFGHVTQFIAEFNETLVKDLSPGLASSAGVSLTDWSREGDDIVSSLRLRSLRKPEMTIPLRITVGTDQVKIGEVSFYFLTVRASWALLPGPSLASSRLKVGIIFPRALPGDDG
jgi:hypothetical protein